MSSQSGSLAAGTSVREKDALLGPCVVSRMISEGLSGSACGEVTTAGACAGRSVSISSRIPHISSSSSAPLDGLNLIPAVRLPDGAGGGSSNAVGFASSSAHISFSSTSLAGSLSSEVDLSLLLSPEAPWKSNRSPSSSRNKLPPRSEAELGGLVGGREISDVAEEGAREREGDDVRAGSARS